MIKEHDFIEQKTLINVSTGFLYPQGASTSTTENFGHRPKRPRVSGKCQDLPGNYEHIIDMT